MATLSDTYDIAAAFLVAAYDALELTAGGAPGRRFVSPGRPALDCCGQLTTWTSLLTDADTAIPPGGMGGARRAQKVGAIPLLTINVQATRCGPTITGIPPNTRFPDPADLTASAQQVNEDLWALWTHINAELRDGTLAEVCKGAYRDGARALEPQGACVGWELTYRYPLNGGVIGT